MIPLVSSTWQSRPVFNRRHSLGGSRMPNCFSHLRVDTVVAAHEAGQLGHSSTVDVYHGDAVMLGSHARVAQLGFDVWTAAHAWSVQGRQC